MSIEKTILHPENEADVDLYPKTSLDQIEGLEELDKVYVKQLVSDPNGETSPSGTYERCYTFRWKGAETEQGYEKIVTFKLGESIPFRGGVSSSDSETFEIGDPTKPTHPVTKQYLENQDYKKNSKFTDNNLRAYCVYNDQQRFEKVTGWVENSTLAYRVSGGRLKVGTATENDDAINYSQLPKKHTVVVDGTIRFIILSSSNTLINNGGSLLSHINSNDVINVIIYDPTNGPRSVNYSVQARTIIVENTSIDTVYGSHTYDDVITLW